MFQIAVIARRHSRHIRRRADDARSACPLRPLLRLWGCRGTIFALLKRPFAPNHKTRRSKARRGRPRTRKSQRTTRVDPSRWRGRRKTPPCKKTKRSHLRQVARSNMNGIQNVPHVTGFGNRQRRGRRPMPLFTRHPGCCRSWLLVRTRALVGSVWPLSFPGSFSVLGSDRANTTMSTVTAR